MSTEALVDELSGLTVMELLGLTRILEEKWGVSSKPVVGVPSVVQTEQPVVEEKTTFEVVLTSFGGAKMAVIKEIRALIPGLGLVDAKNLVEAAPKTIMTDVDKDKAESVKTRVEAIGGKIEIR